jgi:transcription termination/antitermination protein NusG
MKRVGENPPSRFPDRLISAAETPWWVAKIKPRQEKALAFDFIKNNIEYYLPLIVKVTRRKDNNKPRKSVLPLFPGYISFCSKDTPVRSVYRTGRVVSVISIKYQRRFIEELTQIYQAIETGVVLEPLAFSYPPGATVAVISGPLRGLRGVIARVNDSDRLVLSVSGLGQASMVIDAAMVKPVEDSSF